MKISLNSTKLVRKYAKMEINLYIYIYKTEASAGTTIFHVSTIFKK